LDKLPIVVALCIFVGLRILDIDGPDDFFLKDNPECAMGMNIGQERAHDRKKHLVYEMVALLKSMFYFILKNRREEPLIFWSMVMYMAGVSLASMTLCTYYIFLAISMMRS
jgi:hypothetical protein